MCKLTQVVTEIGHIGYTHRIKSVTLARRTEIFLGKIRQCENLLVKRLLRM